MHLFLLLLLAAGPAVEGNPKSPLRVLIFEDLQSADCAKLRLLLDEQLLVKYGAAVAFEHHDFPRQPLSRKAAMAARYFDIQNPNVGLEFRRQVLASTAKEEDFSTWVAGFARQFAIDAVKAVAAMRSPSIEAALDKDVADAVERGVTKTPTVFVNGKAIAVEHLEIVLSGKL
jgi:protein-disulfide isomerase